MLFVSIQSNFELKWETTLPAHLHRQLEGDLKSGAVSLLCLIWLFLWCSHTAEHHLGWKIILTFTANWNGEVEEQSDSVKRLLLLLCCYLNTTPLQGFLSYCDRKNCTLSIISSSFFLQLPNGCKGMYTFSVLAFLFFFIQLETLENKKSCTKKRGVQKFGFYLRPINKKFLNVSFLILNILWITR